MDFLTRLRAAQRATRTCLCVGLDPDLDRLPAPFRSRPAAEAVVEFCIAITEATAPYAAAFKPNLAFFEAIGPDGADALAEVVARIPDDRLVIADGKRGDIGNTAARYASSLFDRLGADAATVAPYMGEDALLPFLQHADRCAFVLVATSNPSAVQVQRLTVDGEPLYLHVARLAAEAGRVAPGTVGFVVGATRPEDLARLRAAFPSIPFLVPGVGAQGGTPEEVLAANDGGPLLVNASRSILYASSGDDFADAAAREAQRLADQLPA